MEIKQLEDRLDEILKNTLQTYQSTIDHSLELNLELLPSSNSDQSIHSNLFYHRQPYNVAPLSSDSANLVRDDFQPVSQSSSANPTVSLREQDINRSQTSRSEPPNQSHGFPSERKENRRFSSQQIAASRILSRALFPTRTANATDARRPNPPPPMNQF